MANPGMSPEILEAMRRRESGAPAPALNQVSPGAAMANTVQPPAAPSSINQASSPPDAGRVQTPKFQAQNRQDLIVQALTEQLKNDNKLEEQKAEMGAIQPTPQPQAQPPQPAPTAPMGGGNPYQSNFSYSSGYEQPMPVSGMQSNYSSGNYSGLNNYGKGGF